MIRERNSPDPDSETMVVNVSYEVYLKGREDPVRAVGCFEVRKDAISPEDPVESFMEIVSRHCLSTIDVVREHRFMLSDQLFNKSFFLTDHIQGISVAAPSESLLKELLQG